MTDIIDAEVVEDEGSDTPALGMWLEDQAKSLIQLLTPADKPVIPNDAAVEAFMEALEESGVVTISDSDPRKVELLLEIVRSGLLAATPSIVMNILGVSSD